MGYVFLAGFALFALLALYQGLGKLPPHRRATWLRNGITGAAGLVALGFLLARRFDIALILAAAAFTVYRTGKLGPFSLDTSQWDAEQTSRVRSHYFEMVLDHDTGAVKGAVRIGQYTGHDLMDLGEIETRELIDEISWDPDSVSLLETWLDANRSGWREYFAEQGQSETSTQAGDPISQALEVLGLAVGASDAEINAAHRNLMKGVHPDHGGSGYLAAKINEARDLLLKHNQQN
ncbi:molecular chaperone DnaJ [Devosia rhodophyticola]|uniref:Molecular chaperone DnaJ n=1 Tax=Devosia rhodophyticola TaxID=3026423 RepID=A0ABY7YZ04_9HYPH|nr:molecular chaperone DnaJ [Devosia rhodophyticola]WDR06481.1 molecular chaperone DnaJ [Devosia rhodophyticola]